MAGGQEGLVQGSRKLLKNFLLLRPFLIVTACQRAEIIKGKKPTQKKKDSFSLAFLDSSCAISSCNNLNQKIQKSELTRALS